ncbi:hypothetical protein [Novosphingobium beihaiensis]|nr:hypothetical protein [Novosphingobium beihaiensis]
MEQGIIFGIRAEALRTKKGAACGSPPFRLRLGRGGVIRTIS